MSGNRFKLDYIPQTQKKKKSLPLQPFTRITKEFSHENRRNHNYLSKKTSVSTKIELKVNCEDQLPSMPHSPSDPRVRDSNLQ